jgi:ergothioneine biosynthesis protein EgtB
VIAGESDTKSSSLPDLDAVADRFCHVRAETERLCDRLEVEDYQLQSMPDCSPPKWHLAHTTWFFEEFILARSESEYRPFHPVFSFLFNSYYESIGMRWPRPNRGLLSRPKVSEIREYRQQVNERILALITTADENMLRTISTRIELGINHEQQHQELLLTDVKHAFGLNPLKPEYAPPIDLKISNTTLTTRWKRFGSSVRELGHDGVGFAFDNEGPRHGVFVRAFEIAASAVTAGAYLMFIDDGGYDRPELWLSDGWAARCRNRWTAPLYWDATDGRWSVFTLRGVRELQLCEPICHLSYYEADAYARWAGVRLPTEAEWEITAADYAIEGNFLDSAALHPTGGEHFFGDVWVWTASPYTAYPGFRTEAGALGEYNAKFMCNQMVLRGGSCVTPAGHIRCTYRNFFPPDSRWQFSGLRLAKDIAE